MKHLVIKNLGPITEADIELKQINIIVGPQSSGKSCILKTACYCTWVEKRIELTQSIEAFEKDDSFITQLVKFHKLYGYVKPDTYVEYESDFMHFSYDHSGKEFKFNWKSARWEYRRPKVTYIPAERYIVAAIPSWFDVKMADDNLRSFMSEWDEARKATADKVDVLNLGVKYRYEPSTDTDKIIERGGLELNLTNTSSGLQSLIPLFVHLNYLCSVQYSSRGKLSVSQIEENRQLFDFLYNKLFADHGTAMTLDGDHARGKRFVAKEEGMPYGLDDSDARRYFSICQRFSKASFFDIFIEEPEENLFPPTQDVLVDWLLEMTEGERASNLFVATHSPYIVTAFLERPKLDISLFITKYTKPDGNVIRTASEEEIQSVYDNGIDVFFNNSYFG